MLHEIPYTTASTASTPTCVFRLLLLQPLVFLRELVSFWHAGLQNLWAPASRGTMPARWVRGRMQTTPAANDRSPWSPETAERSSETKESTQMNPGLGEPWFGSHGE